MQKICGCFPEFEYELERQLSIAYGVDFRKLKKLREYEGEDTDIAITIEYDKNNIPTRDTIQAYSKELNRRLKLYGVNKVIHLCRFYSY